MLIHLVMNYVNVMLLVILLMMAIMDANVIQATLLIHRMHVQLTQDLPLLLVLTVLIQVILIKLHVKLIKTMVLAHLLIASAFVPPVTEALRVTVPTAPHARVASTRQPQAQLNVIPVLRVATLLLLTEVIAKSLTLLVLTPNALLLAPAQPAPWPS